jgi:hypothetical protein
MSRVGRARAPRERPPLGVYARIAPVLVALVHQATADARAHLPPPARRRRPRDGADDHGRSDDDDDDGDVKRLLVVI